MEEAQGVREHVDDGVELFDASLGAPRRVDDDRIAAYAGDATGEPAERVAQPHRLGQAGCLALDDRPRPFGCLIAGSESRPARRHDEAGEPFAQLDQRRGDEIRKTQ